MNKLGASLIGSLLFAGALALTGCTGDTGAAGSGNPGVFGNSGTGPGTGPGPVPGPTGTRVQLLASSPQMPSSGLTTRSEERREGKSVDLGGRRIIKKKKE